MNYDKSYKKLEINQKCNIISYIRNKKDLKMGFFDKIDKELTIENISITTMAIKVGTRGEFNAPYFVCVEDPNINGSNIKEYVLEELKKFDNRNTLSEFQRTPFGFCGVAVHTNL
jgi:hypothetical protein